MSNQPIRDMSGALFPARERKSERSPDYTGDCVIRETKFRLSAWKKTSKTGGEFLSLAISEWVDRPASPPPAPQVQAAIDNAEKREQAADGQQENKDSLIPF